MSLRPGDVSLAAADGKRSLGAAVSMMIGTGMVIEAHIDEAHIDSAAVIERSRFESCRGI
jgi:hypothetical protein